MPKFRVDGEPRTDEVSDQPVDDTEAHGMRGKSGAPGTDEPPEDNVDTEGHRRAHGAPDTDQPPDDEADAEGHRKIR